MSTEVINFQETMDARLLLILVSGRPISFAVWHILLACDIFARNSVMFTELGIWIVLTGVHRNATSSSKVSCTK